MSTWLVVWGIWHVYFVEAVFPNAILWLHYYAASYEFGFVRRGLGGELIRMLTGDHFFAGAYTVLWTSITVWLIALAVVVWLILSTGNRSERRIMLALLVPVLPFAFSYAIYNPHPELFGMTALVAFSIFLTRAHTSRTRVILSTPTEGLSNESRLAHRVVVTRHASVLPSIIADLIDEPSQT